MAYENERAERDFRMNPPESAPGQGSGDDGWGDLFDSMPTGSSSAEPSTGSNPTSPQPGINMYDNTGMQNQQQSVKSTEDKIFDGAVVLGKGIFKYFKYVIDSLKNNTHGDWHILGVKIVKNSCILGVIGFLFCVINLFTKSGNTPIDMIIGSVLSMMCGVFLCMFYDKDDNTKQVEEPVMEQPDDSFSFDDMVEESPFEMEDEDYEEITDDTDLEDFTFDDEDIDRFSDGSIESDSFSVEDAVGRVAEIQMGTQTRSYLYETFMSVLPLMNPEFSTMKEIYTDSDRFYEFENLLRSAAYQVGTKDENIPELESIYENDFIFRLNCTRPVGLKEQAIADELANAYSRDDNNRLKYEGCYATVETSVGKYTINVFKGAEKNEMGELKNIPMVSLADVYKVLKNFMCNTKVEMPFVWGVNELGEPLFCDIKDNNSIIISGEPRGGKSWKGQSLIAQLAMFHSPKEINFYFFDGKDTASDYRYLSSVLPHAKYFCGDMDKINDGLDRVIQYMVDVQGKTITDAGCINIKDYNRTHPDNKLPYVYIVIDELMSLMNHFIETNQKEEGARFRSFLSTMVSKLPYTGIRFVLFPHRIVNDIISKNTYSLVSCRAVVRQTNFDELKNAIEVTEKKFPYRLVLSGDMAVKMNEINSGNPVYCHSEVLTSTNEANRRLFDYIGAIWKKLEPDCECISFNGKIGGYIGVKPTEKLRTVKPARDNTQGMETFEYKGYESSMQQKNMDTSNFNVGSTMDDLVGGTEFNDSDDGLDVDSDFWSSF